ncbi:MAG: hypothetical protein NT023_23795 [Armatimonadetes bacterium]|nr:hypothetical protein [Armatimonadota bacterium]
MVLYIQLSTDNISGYEVLEQNGLPERTIELQTGGFASVGRHYRRRRCIASPVFVFL